MAYKQPVRTKAIGKKMKTVRTYEGQENMLLDWEEAWYKDHSATLKLINKALRDRDIPHALQYLDQLESLSDKRFDALENIIKRVCDPDRQLKRQSECVAPEEVKESDMGESEPQNDILKPPVTKPRRRIGNDKISENEEAYNLMDELAKGYNAGMSLTEMAKINNISDQKVRKILVTMGIYSGETYDRIKDLRLDGYSEEEIAKKVGISLKALNTYTPYAKSPYNLNNASKNALKLREWKAKKNIDK